MKTTHSPIRYNLSKCRMLLAATAAMLLVILPAEVARAQAPQLTAVMPMDGATNATTDALVVFTFDKPMNTTIPIVTESIPPFFIANVDIVPTGFFATGIWSNDGLTLTCPSIQSMTPGTTFTWTLNPPGTTIPPLTEQFGTLLATVSGSFTTGGSGGEDCDPDGIPDTWGSYSLRKLAAYLQISTADPAPASEFPFSLTSFVSGPQAGPTVTSASLTLPNTTQSNLTQLAPSNFILSDGRDTEAALDAAYPAGTYTLRFMQTGEPERVIPMSLPASGPPVPKIANYTAAQTVNAGQDFTLQWNSFAGAGVDDFIFLTITDVDFEAPDPCVPRELLVADTSIVIPAGTLQSNQTYQAFLSFQNSFYQSTNTVPEMSGSGAFLRATEFTIKTGTGGSGTVEAGRWTEYRLLPNGNPQLDFSGTALATYMVQRASNVSAPTWLTVGSMTLDASGNGVFEDTQPGKIFPLYYRTAIIN